ncbi:MAG: ATP-binding protein [Gaiellaceae bacterium]
MQRAIFGRDDELASIADFTAGVSDGASALVLEGEAGMGKTTLWEAGVEGARGRGLLVLRARAAEGEVALSFSGLGDLLDPVLEDVLAPLPAAQRRALSRALLLGEDEAPTPDPHAVGVAVLNALRALAVDRGVVVAVDDVQWLDTASAAALGYAARRLRDELVGVLLARRTPLESGLVGELRRSLEPGRCSELEVGPLDPSALHHVVRGDLGVVLPRPLLVEVHDASGGNPFYALEIVRTLRRRGVSVEAGQPLPVPESLHDLVHDRLLALPAESRDFLLAAAAHAHPRVPVVVAASGVEPDAGLAPALEAGIVELDGSRIAFTHPLLAAGAYETADPLRRAEIHTRLSELLEDPEARAWQLAAAVDEPDETVARALEDAARHARGRGALRPAALLVDRAHELTPADRGDDVVRRGTEAAYLHFESGDSPRAEASLRELVAPLAPGPLRARAVVALARIRLYEAPDEAKALFAEVVEEAGEDLQTLAFAHEGAAACSIWMFERFEEALAHTDVALALSEELGDDALTADVLLTRLTAETLLGRDTALAVAERALALQGSAADRPVLDQPLVSLAEHWTWVDAHARARDSLLDLMQRADELGDENARPWLSVLLGGVELALGNLETALQLAREGQQAAEQSGQPLFRAHCLALECLVQAQLGRAEDLTRAAEEVLDFDPDRYTRAMRSSAFGHLALALGRPDEVVAHLEPAVAFVRDDQLVEPGATRFVVDYVEALVELGRRDEAVELLDWYEGNARMLERASALASCLRCRGMLAAQSGALDEALATYEEALAWHTKVELPLDRARTLLALGAAQRRAKRRREARATLEEALAVFERAGAALWEERARAELKRISGRAPAPGALTPAEERVAALVAEGKTNREVAAALFLSDRTVEGHLSHIFGKLGIRHRAELARALDERESRVTPSSNAGDSPVSAPRVAP